MSGSPAERQTIRELDRELAQARKDVDTDLSQVKEEIRTELKASQPREIRQSPGREVSTSIHYWMVSHPTWPTA